MNEPSTLLESYTRIKTHETLDSTGGMMVSEDVMARRQPNAIGTICGIVPGHGGDVYWVAHIGSTGMAPYGWMEFELEPEANPKCQDCKGGGIDFPTSSATKTGTACPVCGGTGAYTSPTPDVWDRLTTEEKV